MDIRDFNDPQKDTSDLMNGYMVYCPNLGAPYKIHRYEVDAIIEAERLTIANPRHRYYVLNITGYIEAEIKINKVMKNPPIIVKDELGKLPDQIRYAVLHWDWKEKIDTQLYKNLVSHGLGYEYEIETGEDENYLLVTDTDIPDVLQRKLFDLWRKNYGSTDIWDYYPHLDYSTKKATDSLVKEIDKLAICKNCEYATKLKNSSLYYCGISYETNHHDHTCNAFKLESEDHF